MTVLEFKTELDEMGWELCVLIEFFFSIPGHRYEACIKKILDGEKKSIFGSSLVEILQKVKNKYALKKEIIFQVGERLEPGDLVSINEENGKLYKYHHKKEE